MKYFNRIILALFLTILTFSSLFSGTPGLASEGKNLHFVSTESLMQMHKVLAKEIEPVEKNAVYNPSAPLRKKHIFNVIGKTILSNIPQTSSFTEAYNAALYYRKVMPEGFSDVNPKYSELFGIAERLLGRNLISKEKDGSLHSNKEISRAEALLQVLKLLEYTDLANVRISDIYQAGMKLNTHLSLINDISANKLQIPGFIKIAQHYHLLPEPAETTVKKTDPDFYASFKINPKDFYYQKDSKVMFMPNVKANLGFLTTLLANNFVKWDFSAADYEKSKAIGNTSDLMQNRVLKDSSFTDTHLLEFDADKGLVHLRALAVGEQNYRELTLGISDDSYIWIVNKGECHNIKGKSRLKQLEKIINEFKSPAVFQISANIILKNTPMKLDVPVLEDTRVSSGLTKRLPQIAYVELIINYFDHTGIITGVSQDKVTLATNNGPRTFWYLPGSKMKVRIHNVIEELNNTLLDKMLDPENIPSYRDNNLGFLKPGFHVNVKLTSADADTVKMLLIPFLKVGMLSQLDPLRNALKSSFISDGYYRTRDQFRNTPLYSISSKARDGFTESNLTSLILLDGSIRPASLYVQPATAKPYDISKDRIPDKSKIDLAVSVE